MIIVDDIFIGAQPGTYSKVAIAVRDGHYCVLSEENGWIRIRRTTKPAKVSGLPVLPSLNTPWDPRRQHYSVFPSLELFLETYKERGLPEYAMPEAVSLML